MNNIFDTHAHYDDEAFAGDLDELLMRLPGEGVVAAVTCAVDLLSSSKVLKLSSKYDYVYAALGIHPEMAGEERKGDLELIAELLGSEKKAIAVGEVGLDYYYEDGAPRETQRDLFERHLALSKDLDLPIIVHDREAHGDTLELLKKYKPKGVVHCFSGSAEMAAEVTNLGMYIGIGGVVTFKNARKTVEVVQSMPIDKLVLETDAPYLAPVPHRGKRNDSSLIPNVAEVIGSIRGLDPQEVLNITKENGCNLFSIEL